LFPQIAREWHPTKNKKIKVTDLVAGSKTQAWWLCKKGHVWKQRVVVRTRVGLDCPQCYRDGLREASDYSERDEKGRIVLGKKSKKGSRIFYERWKKSYVPLTRSHPKIAKEWHPTRNGPFKPADFATSAYVVAWWKCNKDANHEWQSVIGARTHRRGSRGCPFCSNHRVNNKNSLQAQFPTLVKEWHPTKNKQLKPEDIVSGSKTDVWWQCQADKRHCWSAPPYRRTKRGSGCPYCAHLKVSDLNSLKKLHPRIAAQFHPTKNGSKKVSEIAVASTNPIWWLCSEGPDHEWRATPSSRTIAGDNCPMCSGHQVSVTNSLATLYPHLAAQWDYRKNGNVTPHDVTSGTPRNFWWLCEAGHNWVASPKSRKKTKGDCYECKTGRPRRPGPKAKKKSFSSSV
jgi:hypothetical protein